MAHPLRTVNAAAQKALPGDTVTVHEGTYREWVNPLYGGIDDARRILYRAAEGERVESQRLGVTKLSNYPYENADGTPVQIDKDYLGKERPEEGT